MSAPAQRYQVADRPPFNLTDLLLRWEVLLIALLVLVVAINGWATPNFLDFYNMTDATQVFSEKAILALAMALLIIAREIDLSVAAIIALASLAMGYCATQGFHAPVLICVGLGVGMLCGMLNGFLVTRLNAPSIALTIGTMSLYRGIARGVLKDQTYTQYPPDFQSFGQDYVTSSVPIYMSFLLFLVLAGVAALVLHAMPVGRKIMASGNNPVAARFSGVPVDRIRFLLFVASGLAAGLASVLLTARLGSTRPDIASGFELEAVTIVVLGGVSILGGSGTIGGVVLAAIVLGLVQFGLSLNNVTGIEISVMIGALLIGAIALPIIVRRLLGRSSTH